MSIANICFNYAYIHFGDREQALIEHTVIYYFRHAYVESFEQVYCSPSFTRSALVVIGDKLLVSSCRKVRYFFC